MSPCIRFLWSLYFNHQVIKKTLKKLICADTGSFPSLCTLSFKKVSMIFKSVLPMSTYLWSIGNKTEVTSFLQPVFSFLKPPVKKKKKNISALENPHSSPRLFKSTSCPSHTFWPTLRFPLAQARPRDVWNVTR